MNSRETPSRPLVRLGSSYRERTAEETLAVARTLMRGLGIARVTDITRMDRLGLPVSSSVRPRAHLLRVHAGKGLVPVEAEVGALMEAIEFALAEPQRRESDMASTTVAQIAAQLGDGLQFFDLIPIWGIAIKGDDLVDAVECAELFSGRRVWIPAELVFVPFVPTSAPALFGWNANGLASGNSLDEATLHALFEILERDALAMSRADNGSKWVDPGELPGEFRALAARWSAIGVELAVRHVPSVTGLPCFEAFLHEGASTDVNLARGSGLHVDRDIALSRAVCEAAQSRLSGIHGGREDITGFYAKYTDQTNADRESAELKVVTAVFDQRSPTRWADIAGPGPSADIPSVLDSVLDRLSHAGFPCIFRYRFALPDHRLHVVKIIVPRCEEIDHHSGRFGPRLISKLTQHA